MDVLGLAVLLPLVHPNLVAPFLSSVAIIFAVVLYKYANVLKSVYLYTPDETTGFAMHPLFRLKRTGVDVYDLMIKTTTFVLVLTPFITFILLPITLTYITIKPIIPYLVILFCILNWKDWRSVALFSICGLLGLMLLDDGTITSIFTGLFGVPLILTKFEETPRLKQVKMNLKALCVGLINSLFILFLPAIGPAQASVLSRLWLKKDEDKVVGIAAINAMEIPISLSMLVTLNHARLGALNYVQMDFNGMLIMGLVVVFLALCFHAIFNLVGKIKRINSLKFIGVGLAIAISLYFGVKSLVCLMIFSLIGFLANKMKINLSNGMGVLVFPYLASI